MSQISSTSSSPPPPTSNQGNSPSNASSPGSPLGQVEVKPGLRPELHRGLKVPPQMRRDFDAALRRADLGEDDDGEDISSSDEHGQLERPEQMRTNLHALGSGSLGGMVPIPSGAMGVGQVSSAGATEALGGSAMVAVPTAQRGTLPDAVPATPNTIATNAEQQWRVNIPVNDPASALALRLVNSGAGNWQVRLAADSTTRVQLTPSLDRLRDKLRQRSGEHIGELGFDEDIGPDDADTAT